MKRSGWLGRVWMGALVMGIAASAAAQTQQEAAPIDPMPVIYDTDMGDDIDDTWALGLILASPALDLKLVVTDSHDTPKKARLVAKFLDTVGQGHIPIGIGEKTSEKGGPQYQWAEDYALADYPGAVHEDGIQAIIDTVQSIEETVALIVVGPCPNLPLLLERAPAIVNQVEVFAMSGSIDRGYGSNLTPDAEYNVRDDIEAARAMYEADWPLTIAPLDTAARVRLDGMAYQEMVRRAHQDSRDHENLLIKTILENYRVYAADRGDLDPEVASSPLYDTVAVYLAMEDAFCQMETLRLRVDERGYTVRHRNGKPVRVALAWQDLDGYENWLIERLMAGIPEADRSGEP